MLRSQRFTNATPEKGGVRRGLKHHLQRVTTEGPLGQSAKLGDTEGDVERRVPSSTEPRAPPLHSGCVAVLPPNGDPSPPRATPFLNQGRGPRQDRSHRGCRLRAWEQAECPRSTARQGRRAPGFAVRGVQEAGLAGASTRAPPPGTLLPWKFSCAQRPGPGQSLPVGGQPLRWLVRRTPFRNGWAARRVHRAKGQPRECPLRRDARRPRGGPDPPVGLSRGLPTRVTAVLSDTV